MYTLPQFIALDDVLDGRQARPGRLDAAIVLVKFWQVLVTLLMFGAALLPEGMAHIDGAFVLYAVLALTVIRMVPIALSLLGSGIRLPTYLFIGWFGPCGLGSILFVLLILEESEIPHREVLLYIIVLTVPLSVILHGISAAPLAAAYGRLAGRMGECEESKPVSELPLR